MGLSWGDIPGGLQSWRGARALLHALLQLGLPQLFAKYILLRFSSCWHRATVCPNAKKIPGCQWCSDLCVSPHRVVLHGWWTITDDGCDAAAVRPIDAPMARLCSPGCRGDGCLRCGGEEAGRVESTSLPQPAAFELLRRRENEILKSSSQTPNDCCSATRVDSRAARGESDTTHPSP